MRKSFKAGAVLGAMALLAACGGTGDFVDQPQLTVAGTGAAETTSTDAINTLFGAKPAPYRIVFCEADRETQTCLDDDTNPTATGIGGLFLPLVMQFRGIDVQEVAQNADGIAFKAGLDAPVNAIPPVCGTVDGVIETPTRDSATLTMPGFYCNWAAIGNVITSAVFSIDRIDITERTFTGYYKLSFVGTGNASGSGYYKARLEGAS